MITLSTTVLRQTMTGRRASCEQGLFYLFLLYLLLHPLYHQKRFYLQGEVDRSHCQTGNQRLKLKIMCHCRADVRLILICNVKFIFFKCLVTQACCNIMGKYWPVAVEVIAFLTFFATSMLEIITQKYIYIAAAKDHANTNKHYFCKTSQNTECCNSTDIGEHIQRSTYTEDWLLYINLASLLMAIPSTVLLGIWSETDGRKVVITVSLLGTVLRVALFITVIQFQESFYFFVIASLITSTLGYNTSLVASSMTFIADITSSGQRTLRIVFLDCAKGFGIGLAYFISGFYFERDWFQHFLWLVLAISIFNVTYVALFLEETILTNEAAPICSCNYFVAVYRLFSFDPGNGRRWRLLTFAIALFIVGIATTGTNNLLILYAQTSLCFTLVWTGYLYGALTLRFIPSLIGVKLLQTITKISNNWLIEAGLLSLLAGLVLAAFSNTTRLFFNGKCYMIFRGKVTDQS